MLNKLSSLGILILTFKYIKGYPEFSEISGYDSESNELPRGDDQILYVKSTLPNYFDWREHGAVSPVKDQGQCNACWAFSTIANIESQYWLQKYQATLSEQFLLDCNTMNAGCNTEGIVQTFSDIITELGGVIRESDYPPYAHHKSQCRWNSNTSLLLPVVGMARVKPLDEDEMVQQLVRHGPLSAAINDAMMADPKRDPLGIDQPTENQCPPGKEDLNHAVLIVGYNEYVDKKSGQRIPYWIIKNSWGSSWGDEGYYYLERGRNACGIATDVSYAIVPDPRQTRPAAA